MTTSIHHSPPHQSLLLCQKDVSRYRLPARRTCCLANADVRISTDKKLARRFYLDHAKKRGLHHEDSLSSLTLQRSILGGRLLVCCGIKNEPSILHSRSMVETYRVLANHLLTVTRSLTDGRSKYLIGIAGSPGAGKSTLAKEVAFRVNELWKIVNSNESVDVAIALPMDGFHLYRWQLDAMEDPEEAHARRGAPWTFDPASLAKSLTCLQNEGQAYFPSFDHGIGDPVEKDIFVAPEHKLVLLEGNYLLLAEGEWMQVSTFFNERWFIDIDIEQAMKRVEKRHIATGNSPELAKSRVDCNDRLNAVLINSTKRFADLIIPSIDINWDNDDVV